MTEVYSTMASHVNGSNSPVKRARPAEKNKKLSPTRQCLQGTPTQKAKGWKKLRHTDGTSK